jgi:hypothetical protein
MHTKCTQLHRISQNGELLAWSGSDFFLTKPAAAIITRANNIVSSDGNTSTPTYSLCTFCRFLVQIWNDAKASLSFLQISKKTQALPLHYLYSNGISFIKHMRICNNNALYSGGTQFESLPAIPISTMGCKMVICVNNDFYSAGILLTRFPQ